MEWRERRDGDRGNEVGLINIKLEENRWLSVVNYYNRATVDFDLNQFKKVNDY